MQDKLFNKRHVARIVIELTTPMGVGSGDEDELKGQLVQKDWNGLPYLPGTSIMGVWRALFEGKRQEPAPSIFGSAKTDVGSKSDTASRLICSAALVVDHKGRVHEEIVPEAELADYFKWLRHLPYRDHVKIDHKGTAKDKAKFGEEVVYRGTRFCLQVEMLAKEEEDELWKELLSCWWCSDDFLLGGGSRKGFGQFTIVQLDAHTFDLTNELDFSAYLALSNALGNEFPFKGKPDEIAPFPKKWTTYTLAFSGENNFLHFGESYNDNLLDHIFKREAVIEWTPDGPILVKKMLIPGSSIKGALAHRVAYHWNKGNGHTLEERLKAGLEKKGMAYLKSLQPDLLWAVPEEEEMKGFSLEKLQSLKTKIEKDIGLLQTFGGELKGKINHYDVAGMLLNSERNEAVEALFGFVVEEEGKEEAKSQIGHLVIEDTFLDIDSIQSKPFYHVAIDRFTHAPIDGALFGEEAMIIPDKLDITIKIRAAEGLEKYIPFLQQAIDDLGNGQLMVGGLVNKGHGRLTASGDLPTLEPLNSSAHDQ